MHAQDEKKAGEQSEQWGRMLKAEGGTTMISVLENWEWPERVPRLKGTLAEVLISARECG